MARVNVGLATEVVTFCDALCMSWRQACEARLRLAQVKAQSYIDKFESKLCDACVACEEALDGVRACLAVATEDLPLVRARQREARNDDAEGGKGEEDEESAAGTATIAALLRLVSQAAMVARAEGWSCKDLLDAVSKDVVTFARNVGLPSRLSPTPWLPGRGQKVKSRVKRDGAAVSAGHSQLRNRMGVRGRSSRSALVGAAGGNGSTVRSVHRPKDVVRLSKHRPNEFQARRARREAPNSSAVNKRRPNRPAVAEPRGSLDLAVGSIKYDMASNPFARR